MCPHTDTQNTGIYEITDAGIIHKVHILLLGVFYLLSEDEEEE